jgi:murein L,D-transpeptidase YcbB/YkuD
MKNLIVTVAACLFVHQALAGHADVLRQAMLDFEKGAAAEKSARPLRVDDGPALRLGVSGPRVRQLRARLAQLGYATPPDGAFDGALAASVRAFQRQHGLKPDGIVERQTLFNLNLDDTQRLHILQSQLDDVETIERREGANRYLVVNIPAFTLHAFEDGREVLESRVIVGRPDRPTPIMLARVVGVKFNPSWVPPPTIVKRDIFKDGSLDGDYLASHGLLLLDNGGRVTTPAGLTQAEVARGGYRFYQPPGDRNALGKLKFELADTPSVYLHDTNQRNLFQRENRSFSSGCVRVERYLELAAWVLRQDEKDIAKSIQRHGTRYVKSDPIPIYFVYWLADVVDGQVVFFDDVYRPGGH